MSPVNGSVHISRRRVVANLRLLPELDGDTR
jgi:hypothetical protein